MAAPAIRGTWSASRRQIRSRCRPHQAIASRTATEYTAAGQPVPVSNAAPASATRSVDGSSPRPAIAARFTLPADGTEDRSHAAPAAAEPVGADRGPLAEG